MPIYLLLKIMFLAVLMAFLTPMKYDVKKSVIIIVAGHVAIWLGNYLIYRYLGEKVLADIFLFTSGIPGYICFSLVARYKGFKVLFTLLTVSIFGTLASFIGKFVDINYQNFLLQSGIKFASFILIIILILKAYRKSYLKLQMTLNKGWGFLCLIPFLMINIICLLLYYPSPIQNRPENIPVVCVVYALNFAFYAILCVNFENIWQLFQLRREREVLAVQTDMYKKQYETMADKIQTMKIYRHDMRHHLSTINGLLSAGNQSEAQKYIQKLNGSLEKTVIEQYCENYIVNVLLSSYIQRAREEKIDVVCDVKLPETIALDPFELSVIFANALDNAINACRKISPAHRHITLLCKDHCGQIYIRVSNSYEGEIVFDGEFPAAETPEHGTGTRSIAAIVQKNGGVFSFAAQGGIFSMTATLKG